jgi:hypothetical protein
MGDGDSFGKLIGYLDEAVKNFVDMRTGNNKRYPLGDIVRAAFSVFFTQSPSFLSFQILMEKNKGNNNARTIFGLEKIPSDNQIRNLLDPTPAEILFPVYMKILGYVEERGGLEAYRVLDNTILVAMDGTGYFHSEKLSCPRCCVARHKDGRVSYSHSAITPVIVRPGCAQVISLPPEFIHPQDGSEKGDCENRGAKRWLERWGAQIKDVGVTLLGDDLYSRQPVIEAVLAQDLHYLFVCKPQSHPWLSEYIENCDAKIDLNEFSIKKWTGKENLTFTSRWRNGVPLRDTKDALSVNWLELVITNEKGEITFKNSYITNHLLTPQNVLAAAEAGRTRWKIENEHNNTLKTKGYHLEHNYGHGKQNLSELLFCLILIAFSFHTVLELYDHRYRLIRQTLPTRKTFFDHIRALTTYFCFFGWTDLLLFMLKGLELEDPGG